MRIVDDAADGGMSPEQRNNIREGLKGILRSAEEHLREELEAYIKSEQITPVVDTVLSLPKNELAEMAETLVSLTSFRQRVSPDAEIEEYHARVFPNETERRRFESNDPSALGKAVADRVIKSTRARPSLVAGRRGSSARS